MTRRCLFIVGRPPINMHRRRRSFARRTVSFIIGGADKRSAPEIPPFVISSAACHTCGARRRASTLRAVQLQSPAHWEAFRDLAAVIVPFKTAAAGLSSSSVERSIFCHASARTYGAPPPRREPTMRDGGLRRLTAVISGRRHWGRYHGLACETKCSARSRYPTQTECVGHHPIDLGWPSLCT